MINGNLPLSDADVADYETLMRSVAGNVGSASHVDSNARGQSSGKWQEAFLHFCPLAGEMARQADAAWHSVAFRGVILEEECMR